MTSPLQQDRERVKRMNQGDKGALREVFDIHAKAIKARFVKDYQVHEALAQELASDCFMRLWIKCQTAQLSPETLTSPLKDYLGGMCKFMALHFYQRGEPGRPMSLRNPAPRRHAEEDPAEQQEKTAQPDRIKVIHASFQSQEGQHLDHLHRDLQDHELSDDEPITVSFRRYWELAQRHISAFCKDLLRQYFWEGNTLKKIGLATGIKEDTVGDRKRQCLRDLRSFFGTLGITNAGDISS